MDTLIIYATKYGSTRKIAELLAARLEGATLHDIAEGPPALADYDTVILGSPLTAGGVQKGIKQLAKKQADTLLTKRLGLFLAGLQGENEAAFFELNFPPALLEAAAAKAFLGGVYDPEKCGFAARKIIGMAAKLDSYTSTIDEEKISEFARRLSQ